DELPKRACLMDSRPPKVRVHRHVPVAEPAKRDFRLLGIKRLPEKPPPLVQHPDHFAALQPRRGLQVAGVDPRVSALPALRAAAVEDDVGGLAAFRLQKGMT